MTRCIGWLTNDGRKIRVCDMDTSHILNALAMLCRRWPWRGLGVLILALELTRRGGTTNALVQRVDLLRKHGVGTLTDKDVPQLQRPHTRLGKAESARIARILAEAESSR